MRPGYQNRQKIKKSLWHPLMPPGIETLKKLTLRVIGPSRLSSTRDVGQILAQTLRQRKESLSLSRHRPQQPPAAKWSASPAPGPKGSYRITCAHLMEMVRSLLSAANCSRIRKAGSVTVSASSLTACLASNLSHSKVERKQKQARIKLLLQVSQSRRTR